ncbi:TcpE family conjugal transfer membrane protein [Nonomuraea sp. NPDC049709]|uniref:TcpE family conjugal transfer membrane protein n=1 Tax=Nonomuraea sp. NPDC049709 TaxID=3154736 RepID=UPI0034172131
MDLPTYTNIWRIEKRLYKLYDLRLPMPLPIVWIGVFVGVFVPWSLLLVLVGVPVEMPWHVLFLVPPGIVTWLSTRPVIEGKRLTELLESHLRYLGQPKAWYRLAPTSEPEAVTFSGRVWRTTPVRAKSKAPRKARRQQRGREGQRITGPRQVRPAVAAAAAAASQAPVAEPPTRTGWGARRGAAPALRARTRHQAAGSPAGPVRREEGLSRAPGRRQEQPVALHDEPTGTGIPPAPASASAPGSATAEREPAVRDREIVRPVDAGHEAVVREAIGGRALPARDPADRSAGGREVAGRPAAGHEVAVSETAGREVHGRDSAGREARGREVTARAAADRSAADRSEADREAGGRARAGREVAAGAQGAPEVGTAHGEMSAEALAAREASVPIRTTESRKPAAGKPIDTEALRRLRRLAASADAPAGTTGRAEGGVRREGERPQDEVARDQHRKGQPPRLAPGLVLSGAQRVWPPLNPDAKPLPRPVTRRNQTSEDVPGNGRPPGDAQAGAASRTPGNSGDEPQDVVQQAPAAAEAQVTDAALEPEPATSAGTARTVSSGSTTTADDGSAVAGAGGAAAAGDGSARAADAGRAMTAGDGGAALAGDGDDAVAGDSGAATAGDGSATVAGDRRADAAGDGGGATVDDRPRAVAGDRDASAHDRAVPAESADAPAEALVPPAVSERRASRAVAAEQAVTVEHADAAEQAVAEEQAVAAAEEPASSVEGEREAPEGVGGREATPAVGKRGATPAVRGRETPSVGSGRAGDRGEGREAPKLEVAAEGVGRPPHEPDEFGEIVTPVPVPRPGEGRVRRVESVVGRDSGGWRRIAQVVVGGGGVRTDGSEIDEARARGVFSGGRRIVVLGCTGGAGQSTTALMLGHTFAQYRDDRVVAVDANTGGGTLTSKIQPETPETLTSLLSGLDRVSGYLTMRGYTTRTASGLEVISADTDAGAEQRLADRSFFSDHRLGESMRLLDRHYKLAVIDPAAALAARLLPYADQLVLVVPASEEASEAVAMTYEWLDGHGCAELRRRAVMVVNGVSRRSMTDVEQAESVARGRCRAIVRVPWEDDLAPGGAEVVDPGQLRAAGRRAYLALAGVVVAGFAAQTVRPSEEELASDPPGTRIGER